MSKEYSDYLKFIDDALELAKAIPRYFSKFSNRTYCNHQKLAIYVFCNHQKLAIYVLMQKFKTTTRGIVSILKASSDMRMHLGLHSIPVHTTIVRFVKRIKKLINDLLGIRQADTVVIDSTGFELESKSYYYRNITQDVINCCRKKTKKFMKLSITIDADKQTILTHKIRKSRAHDTKDFKTLVNKLKFKKIIADKGYDSRKIRNYIIRTKKATPIIPIRRHTNYYGTYQNGKKIPGQDYPKRSMIENIFFCIKRKYSSTLKNKSITTQKVELTSKLIAHNIDKKQHHLLLTPRVAPTPIMQIFLNYF